MSYHGDRPRCFVAQSIDLDQKRQRREIEARKLWKQKSSAPLPSWQGSGGGWHCLGCCSTGDWQSEGESLGRRKMEGWLGERENFACGRTWKRAEMGCRLVRRRGSDRSFSSVTPSRSIRDRFAWLTQLWKLVGRKFRRRVWWQRWVIVGIREQWRQCSVAQREWRRLRWGRLRPHPPPCLECSMAAGRSHHWELFPRSPCEPKAAVGWCLTCPRQNSFRLFHAALPNTRSWVHPGSLCHCLAWWLSPNGQTWVLQSHWPSVGRRPTEVLYPGLVLYPERVGTLSRTVATFTVHKLSRPILCLGANPPPPPLCLPSVTHTSMLAEQCTTVRGDHCQRGRDGPDLETQTRRPAWRPQKADLSRLVPTNNQNAILTRLLASSSSNQSGFREKTLFFSHCLFVFFRHSR